MVGWVAEGPAIYTHRSIVYRYFIKAIVALPAMERRRRCSGVFRQAQGLWTIKASELHLFRRLLLLLLPRCYLLFSYRSSNCMAI